MSRETARERRRRREVERAQALLRRLDLEEVLEELGMDTEDFVGNDAYFPCPDPDHEDGKPSFHVCVDDVEDGKGGSKLGIFHCWSHPDPGLSGRNFLDLVARVLFEIWGDAFPKEEDRTRAEAWLRETFLGEDEDRFARRRERAVRRRWRAMKEVRREVVLPPSRPVAEADPRFLDYLVRREVTPERAAELDVRAVSTPGYDLKFVLGDTCPAVLFPIYAEGKLVNWFARGISKYLISEDKGRYAPVPLANAGVLWLPGPVDFSKPVVLTEGIFDVERARAILLRRQAAGDLLGHHPGNFAAVLGAYLSEKQARRLWAFPLIMHLGDGDEGGKTLGKSIRRGLESHVRVVSRLLPDGFDPGDAAEDDVVRALDIPRAPSKVGRRIRRSVR